MRGDPGVGDLARGEFADSILEAKLHPPQSRAEWIDRARLRDLLSRAVQHPLTVIAAPAGYGKTTVVAQWIAGPRSPASVAWVSLDAGDNDPVRLWTHVTTALQRAGCPVASDLTTLSANSGEVMTGVLTRMVNVLSAMADDVIIVLDDFHFVRDPTCHAQVELLIEHLPAHVHLVVLTRADPALRLGRHRVTGNLAEIRAADLAFTAAEASSLMAVGDVQLSDRAASTVLDRTEGWPAGLYLATLALSGRDNPDDFVHQLSGDDRFIGDYLTEEVLTRHTDDVRDFITRVSILDRFCAQLCDVVADTTGSAAVLNQLERSNLFLVPLDRERRWFRFHHLFAAVARSELEAEHPDLVKSLHGRAADWFGVHGYADEAVHHSLAADKVAEASLIVQANWLKYVDAGRAATVRGWLGAIGEERVAAAPAALVAAAWLTALSGDEETLAAQLVTLGRFGEYGPLPDETTSVESAIALIRGVFGFGGPDDIRAAGCRAVELETNGRTPWYAMAHFAVGHGCYLADELDRAALACGIAAQNDAAPDLVRVLSWSVLSLVEADRGQAAESQRAAELAMGRVVEQELDALPQCSLAFTAMGRAQAAAGKTADAMATLERGLALRRKNPTLSPWPLIHHLLVMAPVALDLGRAAMAQEMLVETHHLMGRYTSGMGPTQARAAAVHRLIRTRSTAPADEPLTPRERQVLGYLQGPLSLSDIAAELYLSPNTVKTHAKGIYRKLGARSRAEAVRLGQQRLLI